MRCKYPHGSLSVLAFAFALGAITVLPGCSDDEPIGTNNDTNGSEDATTDESETGDTEATGAGTSSPSNTTTTTTTTPNTTTSGETTLPEGVPTGTAVGIGCEDDDDCVSPLTCVKSDDSFRGSIPGGGICSRPCVNDDECSAVDALAVCGALGSATPDALEAAGEDELPEGLAQFCVQLCPFGLDASKCGNLATSTCYPIAEVTELPDGQGSYQLGLCTPMCNTDDDCSSGEHCDPSWGMCLEDAIPGKELGELCDPAAETAECKGGFCLGIAEELDFGICSQPCNFHPDTVICGDQSAAAQGCYPNLFADLASSINDMGQCLPLCDEDQDCPKGLACDTSESQVFEDLYGRPGMCFPTDESIAAAISDPDDETTDDGDSTTGNSTAEPIGDAG